MLSCAEQGEFITHELQAEGMSASAGDQGDHRKKHRQSLKMKKLLKQSKIIKNSLKRQQVMSPDTIKKTMCRQDRGGRTNQGSILY